MATSSVNRLITLMLVATCQSACAAGSGLQGRIADADVHNVHISVDVRIEHDYCESWTMSEDEIRQFFQRAQRITEEQRTMAYQWGGCDLEGEFVWPDATMLFSINAGGTGSIVEGARQHLFGCQSQCEDLVDFGFY